MTHAQAILSEARALAEDDIMMPEARIEVLEMLKDEFDVLIDELANEVEQ